MTDADKPRFFALLGGVHDFYGKELTKFAADIWWQACRAAEFDSVSRAFSQHLADPENGRWMPKPADLVRQLQGTRGDRSRRAWGKVLAACQTVGAYRSVAFDEPAIHAAIEDCGGWVTVCRTHADELPHLERRFCQAYSAYIEPGRLERWAPVLIGETERENRVAGHAVAEPVLIGDPDMAAATVRDGADGPRVPMVRMSDAIKRVSA